MPNDSFIIDERRVLDHGFVGLTRVDGSDLWIVRAARNSYRDIADMFSDKENGNLIEFLLANRHTTPFESCGAVLLMTLPIFVARQWVRHRTSWINEESLRYVEARDEYYIPDVSRMQGKSKDSKQGSSSDLIDDAEEYRALMERANNSSYQDYRRLIEGGLAPELARTVLPVATYTGWYWGANLHNILHLLKLRMDPHAQYEIRVYANAVYDMLKPHFPMTFQAWENHVLNSVTFSREEQSIIKAMELSAKSPANFPEHYSKRKIKAFNSKLDKLLGIENDR
jgi:thymidylate synthase (FAD)